MSSFGVCGVKANVTPSAKSWAQTPPGANGAASFTCQATLGGKSHVCWGLIHQQANQKLPGLISLHFIHIQRKIHFALRGVTVCVFAPASPAARTARIKEALTESRDWGCRLPRAQRFHRKSREEKRIAPSFCAADILLFLPVSLTASIISS